jgi:hypothetical protein
MPVVPAAAANDDKINEDYVNPLTAVLGAFVPSSTSKGTLDSIDWGAPKRKKARSLKDLAVALEKALGEREWFVTGNVDPTFFSDDFAFQDPDVKIKGIESYARGVNKIFNQQSSRAEVIAARVNGSVPDTITVTWRLEGKVNVGLGLRIKPFVVYTDLLVDSVTGLVTFQEDRFSNPGPDILLSSLFPFLIGSVLLPPAPPAAVLRAAFLEEEQIREREQGQKQKQPLLLPWQRKW